LRYILAISIKNDMYCQKPGVTSYIQSCKRNKINKFESEYYVSAQ